MSVLFLLVKFITIYMGAIGPKYPESHASNYPDYPEQLNLQGFDYPEQLNLPGFDSPELTVANSL